jgi:cytochrome c553
MPSFAKPLLLAALLATSSAQAATDVPNTLAQRLVACTSCHARKDAQGQPGGDRYFPRISGKPAGYLYNQLVNFRDGRRQYPLMTWMVERLPDAYLHEIADYFAAQHPPYPPAPPGSSASADVAQLARGETLAKQGDASRRIPACVACHGVVLTGVQPAIPGLIGLPSDYINAQFGAWRNKARRAAAPDCMADIAARLSVADVAAVSAWLAMQKPDATARPAASIAQPLPLACGSMPGAEK